MAKKEISVPICQKLLLTSREAAEYSNLGINHIARLTNDPYCTFVIYNGRRKLIKRKEFEEFISKSREV